VLRVTDYLGMVLPLPPEIVTVEVPTTRAAAAAAAASRPR
jgi:hypothetical protein